MAALAFVRPLWWAACRSLRFLTGLAMPALALALALTAAGHSAPQAGLAHDGSTARNPDTVTTAVQQTTPAMPGHVTAPPGPKPGPATPAAAPHLVTAPGPADPQPAGTTIGAGSSRPGADDVSTTAQTAGPVGSQATRPDETSGRPTPVLVRELTGQVAGGAAGPRAPPRG